MYWRRQQDRGTPLVARNRQHVFFNIVHVKLYYYMILFNPLHPL